MARARSILALALIAGIVFAAIPALAASPVPALPPTPTPSVPTLPSIPLPALPAPPVNVGQCVLVANTFYNGFAGDLSGARDLALVAANHQYSHAGPLANAVLIESTPDLAGEFGTSSTALVLQLAQVSQDLVGVAPGVNSGLSPSMNATFAGVNAAETGTLGAAAGELGLAVPFAGATFNAAFNPMMAYLHVINTDPTGNPGYDATFPVYYVYGLAGSLALPSAPLTHAADGTITGAYLVLSGVNGATGVASSASRLGNDGVGLASAPMPLVNGALGIVQQGGAQGHLGAMTASLQSDSAALGGKAALTASHVQATSPGFVGSLQACPVIHP